MENESYGVNHDRLKALLSTPTLALIVQALEEYGVEPALLRLIEDIIDDLVSYSMLAKAVTKEGK